MILPEPCRYFNCVNPCLRGLALQPLEECTVKYARIVHTPQIIQCHECGNPIELTEHDVLKPQLVAKYLCKDCTKKERSREYQKRYRQKTRIKAMKTIKIPLQCERCQEKNIDLLCIDHIHDDGNTERKNISKFSLWKKICDLTQEEARQEYQILCRNCNWQKHVEKLHALSIS